jgi:hypothetical protein
MLPLDRFASPRSLSGAGRFHPEGPAAAAGVKLAMTLPLKTAVDLASMRECPAKQHAASFALSPAW